MELFDMLGNTYQTRLLPLLATLSVTACLDASAPQDGTLAGDLHLEAVPPPTIMPLHITSPRQAAIPPQIAGFAYVTLIGSTGLDLGNIIAADSSGNAYMGGATDQCPTSTSALLVVKLDPTGSVVYALCFSGVGSWGIAADQAGNAYIAGDTALLKLNPTGELVYSIGLGRRIADVAVDLSGNAFIAVRANDDVVVGKVNATGTALLYNVAFGGSNIDMVTGIDVDAAGNAIVVGYTISGDFPRLRAFQPSLGGNADAFVAKLNPTGSQLLYSTYLGGSAEDVANRVAVDSVGSAYIAGSTRGTFPVKSGAAQVSKPGGIDGWVTKLDPSGARVYGTYVGGSQLDNAVDIAVDPITGAAVVTGVTGSTNLPNTTGIPLADGGEAFVAQLNPAGSAFSFARPLGGVGNDAGLGAASDSSGHVYVAGFTESPAFPLGGGEVPNHGGRDAFVIKFNP